MFVMNNHNNLTIKNSRDENELMKKRLSARQTVAIQRLGELGIGLGIDAGETGMTGDFDHLQRHQLIQEKRKLEQSGVRVDWGSIPIQYLYPAATFSGKAE